MFDLWWKTQNIKQYNNIFLFYFFRDLNLSPRRKAAAQTQEKPQRPSSAQNSSKLDEFKQRERDNLSKQNLDEQYNVRVKALYTKNNPILQRDNRNVAFNS